MTYRPLDFTIEIPEPVDDQVATNVTDMGQRFIGIAVDVTDDLVPGDYRFALTHEEARRLHAALGAALADAHFPIKS